MLLNKLMELIKKIIIVLILIFSSVSFSQKKEILNVNIDDLMTETQKVNDATDSIEMIWWMPIEYWSVVLAKDASTNNADAKNIINLLKDYVILIAVKGDVGLFGGITYKERELIKKELKIFYNGSKLKLLSEDDLNPDLKNFITAIGPMMKNMLGQMGENMQVFIYQDDKKQPIDVYGNGNLDLELGDFKPRIEFPLGSLILEKKCPEGGKLFNGKWSYCPLHGKKLTNI